MRTKPIQADKLDVLLACLTPQNALACRLSLETGLRIDDVLSIKTHQLTRGRWTLTEGKTLKRRRIYVPVALREELMRYAGKVWVWPHRIDPMRHRTRQAVYMDIKRAAKLLRLGDAIAPHSMRKTYAVDMYRATGNLKRVKELLNHKYEATTLLYALADVLTERQAAHTAVIAKG